MRSERLERPALGPIIKSILQLRFSDSVRWLFYSDRRYLLKSASLRLSFTFVLPCVSSLQCLVRCGCGCLCVTRRDPWTRQPLGGSGVSVFSRTFGGAMLEEDIDVTLKVIVVGNGQVLPQRAGNFSSCPLARLFWTG